MKPNISIYRYHNYPEEDEIMRKKQTRYGFLRKNLPYFLGAYILIMIVLGVNGFSALIDSTEEDKHFWHEDWLAFWLTLELPLGNTLSKDSVDLGSDNQVGRVPVTLTISKLMGVTFAFSALVVITWNSLKAPLKRIRIRIIKYTPARYDVICGMGWKAYELARDLRSNPAHLNRWLLIIDIDPDNPFIKEFRDDVRVIFIQGDATRQNILEEAAISRASSIYVLNNDDELNSRIAKQIINVVEAEKKQREPIPCYVHIKESRTRSYLEDSTNCKCTCPPCNVRTFNVEENTVRRLLMRHPVAPVDAGNKEESHTHLVIFGDGAVGQALFVELLRTSHFHKNHKLHLTWYLEVEPGGALSYKDKIESIYARWPFLDPKWIGDEQSGEDCRIALRSALSDTFPYALPLHGEDSLIEFKPLPVAESDIRSRSHSLYQSLEKGWNLHLYFCIENCVRSTALATVFKDCVNAWQGLDMDSGKSEDGRKVEAIAFGEYSDECKADALRGCWIDPLAQRVDLYYSIKTSIEYNGQKELASKLAAAGDLSRMLSQTWNGMREWQRESNRQCAAHLVVKLRMLGIDAYYDSAKHLIQLSREDGHAIQKKLKLGEIEQVEGEVDLSYFTLTEREHDVLEEMADMEHRRWSAERFLQGWMPIYDKAEWRIHHKRCRDAWHLHADLKPYAQLDPSVKEYDRFIVANITLLFNDGV